MARWEDMTAREREAVWIADHLKNLSPDELARREAFLDSLEPGSGIATAVPVPIEAAYTLILHPEGPPTGYQWEGFPPDCHLTQAEWKTLSSLIVRRLHSLL